jgi:hypothetical protein
MGDGKKNIKGLLSMLNPVRGYDIFISYKTSEGAAYASALHEKVRVRYRAFLDNEALYS